MLGGQAVLAFIDQFTNWIKDWHTQIMISIIILWLLALYVNRLIDRYQLQGKIDSLEENKSGVDAMYKSAIHEAEDAHNSNERLQLLNTVLAQSIVQLTSTLPPEEQEATMQAINTRINIEEANYE
jgi:predicted exporter